MNFYSYYLEKRLLCKKFEVNREVICYRLCFILEIGFRILEFKSFDVILLFGYFLFLILDFTCWFYFIV